MGELGKRAGLGNSRELSAWWPLLLVAVAAVLLMGAGCGSGDRAETQNSVEMHEMREVRRQRAQRHAAVRRAHAHARREAARRRARHVRYEHERRAREHQARLAEERAEIEAAAERKKEEAESSCDPNYSGACLNPAASDYDCEGGSGNGPYYTATVTVVGEDHYGLDADGDGTGCEIE